MAGAESHIRYEPDEIPPPLVAIGAGLQAAVLIVTPVVLTVVIVARLANVSEDYVTWGVFAAMIISGLTTILQVVRVGRVGSGSVLIMGTSAAFIAVCVAALVKAGPCDYGESDHRFIHIPVFASGSSFLVETDLHPGRNRNSDHVDRSDGGSADIRLLW